MIEFKVGDRVKLRPESRWNDGRHEMNPLELVGTVIEVNKSTSHKLTVKWSNGCENTYDHEDLYFDPTGLKVVYMIGTDSAIDNVTVFATEEEAKTKIMSNVVIDFEEETNTKIVKYFGKLITVPAYARFIAVDENGAIFAYSVKPKLLIPTSKSWYASSSSISDGVISEYKKVGVIKTMNINWTQSLQEISND